MKKKPRLENIEIFLISAVIITVIALSVIAMQSYHRTPLHHVIHYHDASYAQKKHNAIRF